MKNLTTLNKPLYYLVYFVLFLYIAFVFFEEYINKKWLLFTFKGYQTIYLEGIVRWYTKHKNNWLYLLVTKNNERILLKTKYHIVNIFDEVKLIVNKRYLDVYDSYENYLYNNFYVDEIGYVLEILEVNKTNKTIYKLFSFIFEKINEIKKSLIKIINKNLSSDISKNIAARLSLGYKDLEIEDVETYFQEAGVAHVLVVSGLHVGFIYILVRFLLKFLPISIEIKEILSLLIMFLYMLLTGCDIPVVRATIMISCFIFSFILKRKGSFYHTLATAAFIILLMNPRSIFSVSFQLSFLVCFGIFYFYNFFNTLFFNLINKQKFIFRYLTSLLLITISAQIAVAGLTMFYFNRFSVISFISNLIVVPYTSVLLWLNLGCYFISFVFKDFSLVFWKFLDFLIFLYFKIVKFFANLPFSGVYVSFDIIKVILYYFLILLLPILIVRKIKNTILIFLTLWILVFFLSCNVNKNFELTFFNVGLGDSIFIKTEDNINFLIDTPEDINIAKKRLKPYLKNYKNIDFLVITHPHYIHYGAAEYILENFNVKKVIIPDFFYDDFDYKKILNKIENKNINLEIINNKKLIKFKNGKIEIEKNRSEEHLEKYILADRNSLFVKIYYKNKLIFLTNDMSADDVIKHINQNQEILVLQIPQHGKFPDEINRILTHLKSFNLKSVINIVSTDEVNFDIKKFHSPVFSTNKWGNIRIIFSKNLDKIRKIDYSVCETKVRI